MIIIAVYKRKCLFRTIYLHYKRTKTFYFPDHYILSEAFFYTFFVAGLVHPKQNGLSR